MSYDVVASENFVKELKRLAKKYSSLKEEIASLGHNLSLSPALGTPIGKDCYKIRLPIRSKGKGKSGGARVITLIVAFRNEVVLLSIYDKSERENISSEELKKLLKEIS